MGSGTGWPYLSVVVTRGSGTDADFCFFFGCGSSVDEARCLDRTGTGTVILVVVRGGSAAIEVPGDGSTVCSVERTGFRASLCEPDLWSSSPRGERCVVVGRRFGFGFMIICVMECLHVIPSWVDVMEVMERKCGGLLVLDVPSGNVMKAMESSHSMDSSKNGRRPAKWFRCIIARAK